MSNLSLRLLIVLLLTFPSASVLGDESHPVEVQLIADTTAIAPGARFNLGVLFDIKPGWHIYWKSPGESGLPTKVRFAGPEGFEIDEVGFPTPVKFTQVGGFIGYGYEKQVLIASSVQAPAVLASREVVLKANASWVACAESCIRGRKRLDLTLAARNDPVPTHINLFYDWGEEVPITDFGQLFVVSQTGHLDASLTEGEVKITVVPKRPGFEVQNWFGNPERGVNLSDISVKPAGRGHAISFKLSLTPGYPIPFGELDSVIAFTNSRGEYRGFEYPVKLKRKQ